MSRSARSKPVHASREVVEVGSDPLAKRMLVTVLVLVVLILTVLFYALFAGAINPPAPRTATEYAYNRAQAMIDQEPGNGLWWSDYIRLLVAEKRYGDAERAIKDAREAVTEATIMHVNNAELQLLMAREQYQEVIDRSTEFLKYDAEYRYQQDIDAAQRGITLSPESRRAQNKVTIETLGVRAQASVQLKDYEDAIGALTTALKADPRASDVYAFRGDVHVLAGDDAAAEADYREALKYLPDYQPAIDGLAALGKTPGPATEPDADDATGE